MIRQKKFVFFLLSIFFIALSVLLQVIHIEKEYTSDLNYTKIGTSWNYVWRQSASIGTFIDGRYVLTGKVTLEKTENVFYFAIHRDIIFNDPDDFIVEWELDGKKYKQMLDLEDQDMRWYEPATFTFPFLAGERKEISFTITTKKPIDSEDIRLVSDNTDAYIPKLRFSWSDMIHPVSATNTDISIISRKDWWANEQLRYSGKVSSEIFPVKRIQKTESEMRRIIMESQADAYLENASPLSKKAITVIRQENGNKLTWPIEKTKRVDSIVVHHTAENLLEDYDDATLIRAIYKYHAISKWWGDIGYNFIVGQRWKIYEWRAGGYYVRWAHAAWNNMGTVGISVIGNFEWQHLNRDQEAWLMTILRHVIEKYGIDVNKTITGYKPCKSDACVFDEVSVSALAWHRDVWTTSCPGANIYSRLKDFRSLLGLEYVGIQPKDNPTNWPIEPKFSEDVIEYYTKTWWTTSPGSNTLREVSGTSPFPVGSKLWPKIQVKLSYPFTEEISLESANKKNLTVIIGGKRLIISAGKKVNVSYTGNGFQLNWNGKEYNGKDVIVRSNLTDGVVRIANWDRIPAWDTTKSYNDNLFRGNILLKKDEWKMIVLNELPLEQYLLWLAEISNNDNPEKVKTIITAARSYAYFYSLPKNRKFPWKSYDASDDPDVFQKYLWYGYEQRSPKVWKLVYETRGEMVKYRNSVIKVPYFSQSNGRTLSYKEYCEMNGGKKCEDIPYLQSVDDPGWSGKNRLGHGYGISGIWATYWANNGWDYKKIIAYYLSGAGVWKVY